MASEYWKRYWSRRKLLGASVTAGTGVAGIALVGCGDDDDDDDGGTPPGGAGATTTTTAGTSPTTEQPRPGGTARYPLEGTNSGNPPTIFPFENLTYTVQHPSSLHYSRLLKGRSGPDVNIADNTELEGDIVQALPEQPDEVTYVFKMKPNVAFHDKPPMNGRVANAQDVARTYDAFLAMSQNAAGWKAVVDKFEATDEETITATLLAPFAPFLVTHASSAEALWFIPVETIDNDQVKSDPVGTGPWVFRQFETSVAMRWDKHPKYHDAPLPYFDKVEASLNNDPQRIVASLQSGDFDWSHFDGTFYNDAQSKLDKEGTYTYEPTAVLGGLYFNFDNKPFDDVRVRLALSRAMDRDGLLELTDQTGQGDWQSHISPALTPYFISPKSQASDFGPSAENFVYDPAEAKSLLSAAGFPDGLPIKITANVDRYGAAAQQSWEAIASSISQAGFQPELTFQEYGAYIQSTFLGKIPEGVGLGPLIGSPRDPDNIFFTNFHSQSARHNWGGTPIAEQAELDAMYDRQRTLLNMSERLQAIKEIQQKMAESMLVVPYTGAALFKYFQPWVQNMYPKNGYPWHVESIAKAWFTEERLQKG
ncbi:MAG: ABC transporter substrate-binding protein [Dehalococcoidia bacterium]|nr:ABC transporter substrate-binding protein [Dehalococcoidia bacterium]